METRNQEPSQEKSLTHSNESLQRGNVERCLEALDQGGEAGLQEELDRMYPVKPSIFTR
jgi:hypothetical protein